MQALCLDVFTSEGISEQREDCTTVCVGGRVVCIEIKHSTYRYRIHLCTYIQVETANSKIHAS